jgi:uncharacterized protein (DUF488 family)
MQTYTIGFTKKTAAEFFSILKNAQIKKLIDIRLNNTSQLSGFAKGKDLKYFLKELCNIDYIHDTYLSPTKDILDDYKNKKITWEEYEKQFKLLLNERNIHNYMKNKYNYELDKTCFLCSEVKATNCHRRLVVEYLKSHISEVNIKHL